MPPLPYLLGFGEREVGKKDQKVPISDQENMIDSYSQQGMRLVFVRNAPMITRASAGIDATYVPDAVAKS
jgi:hypothetical protein